MQKQDQLQNSTKYKAYNMCAPKMSDMDQNYTIMYDFIPTKMTVNALHWYGDMFLKDFLEFSLVSL